MYNFDTDDTRDNPLIKALDDFAGFPVVSSYYIPEPDIYIALEDRATEDEVLKALKIVEGYVRDFTDAVAFLQSHGKKFTAVADRLRASLPAVA
jgi:hypothetical protein